PRVYRVAGAPRTWLQRAFAASLWLDGEGAVSHRAAAAIWGLDGFKEPEVSVVTARNLRAPRGSLIQVHARASLTPRDVRCVQGIRVTSLARTLVDLAAVLSRTALEHALDDTLVQRRLKPREVFPHLARIDGRGRKGAKQLRLLVES